MPEETKVHRGLRRLKKSVEEARDYYVNKALGVMDAPFEARTGIRNARNDARLARTPRHRPVRDERKLARKSILPGPPGESLPGDPIGKMPDRAPKE